MFSEASLLRGEYATISLSGLKNLKINIKRSRKKQEETSLPPTPPKTITRGFKVLEKYPLYEPFAHVIIIQNQNG
jgi:hypothetical protein